jgi:hypothetical protein
MACPSCIQEFENHKKEFIDSVLLAYHNFLLHNGIDIEGQIRKQLKDERKIRRRAKKWERVNERIANEMFYIENDICEQIQSFYGDICDIDLTSEWYIVEDVIYIKFTFAEFEVNLWNDCGKVRLDGCPKNLKKHLLKQEVFSRFIEVDTEYGDLYCEYSQ